MKKKLIIVGASGGCLDLVDLVNDINNSNSKSKYSIEGFLDDKFIKNSKIMGFKVLGKFKDAKKYSKKYYFATSIGSSDNFRNFSKIVDKLKIDKSRFVNLIHPTTYISKSSKIGIGCVFFQNVVISTNAVIKNFVRILPNSIIHHDSIIGNHCKINSMCSISGSVTIDDDCYIGASVSVKEMTSISKGTLLGMGSVVLKSIKRSNSIYAGCPAKKINKN